MKIQSRFKILIKLILICALLLISINFVSLSTHPVSAAPSSAASGIVVGIKNNGTDNNQQTAFAYQIKNTSSSAVSGLTVRVYFTTDNGNPTSNYTFEKYYDQSGVAIISGPTLVSGSTYYYTVSYGTAALAAGASWEYQTSLHLSNWGSNFDGTNDWYHTGYALATLPAVYTDTNYIPAYTNGTLVWGAVPGSSTPVPATATTVPSTATATFQPPTNTSVPATAVPATATLQQPTNTLVPASPTPGVSTTRIEAGGTANFTDHNGNVWIAETGFTGGGVVDRGNIAIANTLDPRIYQTEHYGMTAFAYAVPNGNYQVNLHFAETYTGITGAGQRVFNVNVEGTAINNIDVFAQTGGLNKALIKTVTVGVTDGQLNLTFAATVNNPEINGIEILPGGTVPTPTTVPPTTTPVPAATLGSAISPNLVGNNVWINPSDQTWSVSGQAGLKIVRIGGIEYDNNFPSNATLTDWVNRIKAMGAEPMIQVSRYNGAQVAANVVNYFNIQTGNKVKFWNIGNEPYCGQNDLTTAGTIASYVKSLAAAMKAVDSSIKIFAPDSCEYDDVVFGALLKGDNSATDISGKVSGKSYYYVDGLSWHRYIGYGPQYTGISGLTTEGASNFLASIQATRTLVDHANAVQGRTGTNALQWGIGELNSSDGPRVCSYENGQMFGEVYGYVMKYGGTYGATWSMSEGGGACGSTDYGFVDANNKPRSSYYHMQMVSQNFTGFYLDGTSNLNGIRAYGSIDTGANRISVMLLNIDTATQHSCTVRLNSTPLTAGECRVNIPAGVGVDFTQTIGSQTSMVLVFNLQGKLVKTISYSRSGNWSAGNAPTIVTFP